MSETPKKPGLASRLFNRGKTFTKNAVAADEIREHSSYVAGLAKKLATPSTSAREETFAAARLRLGLTDQDLLERHKQFAIRYYIFFFFFVLCLVIMGYSAYRGSLMTVAAGVGFLAFSIAQMAASAFRAAQIQLEELIDFPTFLDRKDLWVPGQYIPSSARKSSRRPRDKRN